MRGCKLGLLLFLFLMIALCAHSQSNGSKGYVDTLYLTTGKAMPVKVLAQTDTTITVKDPTGRYEINRSAIGRVGLFAPLHKTTTPVPVTRYKFQRHDYLYWSGGLGIACAAIGITGTSFIYGDAHLGPVPMHSVGWGLVGLSSQLFTGSMVMLILSSKKK